MSNKSPITTHVLDTARGRPARGVRAVLAFAEGGGFRDLSRGETDADGRITNLLAPGDLRPGTYKLTFETGPWQAAQGTPGFYPYVDVVFSLAAGDEHVHVPLLLSPFGYSTYRGS
jgi:5-hydroxyisourate hydrolase